MSDIVPGVWNTSKEDTSREEFISRFLEDVPRVWYKNSIIPDIAIANSGCTSTIRLVTFNIHYWKNIKDEPSHLLIYNALRNIKADVVALQEVLIPENIRDEDIYHSDGVCISDILSPLSYTYNVNRCIASHAKCGKDTGYGNILALHNRHITTSTSSILLDSDIEQRCAVFTTTNINGIPFVFASIHLDVFDDTNNTRMIQCKKILDYVGEKYNGYCVVLCGDFNCMQCSDYTKDEVGWLNKNSTGIDFDTVEYIRSRGFIDVTGTIKYSVWTGRRVDYIFMKKEDASRFKVDAYVYYSDSSDHFPIIVDIHF